MIAGGGTGGHVFPGIAVAEAARRRDPGGAVLFVGGARGIEARAVPGAGFPIELLPAAPLRGRRRVEQVVAVGALVRGVGRARRLVRTFAPDAVIGLGGYASAPAVVAARMAGVPTVLLEQNARPGLTTRLLARLADRVCTSFEETARHLPAGKAILTGNPVRWTAPAAAPSDAAARAGLGVLIVGGSAGARRLNDAGPVMARALADVRGLRLVHQTGAADEAAVRAAYAAAGVPAAVHAFIADMAAAYGAADVVVCRAGATTIAELAGLGKPAVLVPYPYAADDHQRTNAESLVAAGAARMVLDAEATGERLAVEVRALAGADVRAEMSRRVRGFARPEAATRVLEVVDALAGARGGGGKD